MTQRVEASAIGKHWLRLFKCMPAQGFKERMTGRYPFESIFVCNDPVSRNPRISSAKAWEPPIVRFFKASQLAWSGTGIKRVLQRRMGGQIQRSKRRGF